MLDKINEEFNTLVNNQQMLVETALEYVLDKNINNLDKEDFNKYSFIQNAYLEEHTNIRFTIEKIKDNQNNEIGEFVLYYYHHQGTKRIYFDILKIIYNEDDTNDITRIHKFFILDCITWFKESSFLNKAAAAKYVHYRFYNAIKEANLIFYKKSKNI